MGMEVAAEMHRPKAADRFDRCFNGVIRRLALAWHNCGPWLGDVNPFFCISYAALVPCPSLAVPICWVSPSLDLLCLASLAPFCPALSSRRPGALWPGLFLL